MEELWVLVDEKWINRETGTEYDKDGYNKDGWARYRINRETKTKYDRDGYDINGFDKFGYNREGYNKHGYDITGYDKNGFNRRRIHRDTGEKFDPEGYDWRGYDAKGFNREGYSKEGYNKNVVGKIKYDKDGYDKNDFDINKIHRKTGTRYDEEGYDWRGYDKDGYDNLGLDKDGYDKDGYDFKGYDRSMYDITGYDKGGFDREGYNREGYNKYGFDKEGYNKKGYNCSGYDREGYDKNGFDKKGIHRETGTEYNLDGKNKDGYTIEQQTEKDDKQKENILALQTKAEKLVNGEITLDEYHMTTELTIEELISVLLKQKNCTNIVRSLHKKKDEYNKLNIPFDKEKYLLETKIAVNDEIITPTEADVDKCIAYLNHNRRVICDKNVRKTVLAYLKGELDIAIEEKSEKTTKQSRLAPKEMEQQKLKMQEQIIGETEKLIKQEKARDEKDIQTVGIGE